MTPTAYDRVTAAIESHTGTTGRQAGTGWSHRCPAHEDHNPSLSITPIEGSVLLHCHAGCNVDDILATINLTKSDLYDEPRGATYHYDSGRIVHRTPDKRFRQTGDLTTVELYHLSRLHNAGPGAVYLCFADDTEILTPTGWQMLAELPADSHVAQYVSDSGTIEFVKPSDRQKFTYTGQMIDMDADWCGVRVTPDHRMLTRWATTRGPTRPVVITAERVGQKRQLPVAGRRNGYGDLPTPAQARLLAAWQADGTNCKRGFRIGWNLREDRKKDRLRHLFREVGTKWREQNFNSTPGWTYLSVDRRNVAWLDILLPEKQFHWGMLDWQILARQALLDELGFWDGDRPGSTGVRYFTANEQCANVVSALAATSGYGSICRRDDRNERPNQNSQWVVNLVPRDWRKLGNTPKKSTYDGPVYCLTVPSGFLVTRRHGKVTIAGNCEGEKDVHAIEAAGGIATTAPMGAKNFTKVNVEPLRGRHVIAVVDDDTSGQTWAALVAEKLHSIVAGLRFVQAAEGKDAADHIAAGHNLNAWTPHPSETDHRNNAETDTPEHEPVILAAIPTYPDVPGPLGDLITHRGGLPAGLVGGAGLAALAAVTPLAELHLGEAWTEYPILWIVPIAPRGSGKTPALDLAMTPVRDLDEQAYRLYADLLTAWKATPPKQRLGDPGPTDPTVLVGDLTLEALIRRLAQTRGAATIAHDEMSMILRSLGEYKTGGSGDRGRLLSLWSSQPWRYQRVGNDTDIYIPRPVVSIVGTLQPPLHHLLGGDEDGLRPRWLPHLANLDPTAQEAGGMATRSATWHTTITKLHSIRHIRRKWTLGAVTEAAWCDARRRWKVEAGGGDETASTSAALVKSDVQCARIALVVAESLNPGVGGLIPPDAMDTAITIVDYVMNSWRALGEAQTLGLSHRDDALDLGVDRLASWLDEHGGRATRRQLQQARVAGARTKDQLNNLLDQYKETFPGTVMAEKPPSGGIPTIVIYAPKRKQHARTMATAVLEDPPRSDEKRHNRRSETYGRSTDDVVDHSLSVGVDSVDTGVDTGVATSGNTGLPVNTAVNTAVNTVSTPTSVDTPNHDPSEEVHGQTHTRQEKTSTNFQTRHPHTQPVETPPNPLPEWASHAYDRET